MTTNSLFHLKLALNPVLDIAASGFQLKSKEAMYIKLEKP